MGYLCPNCQKTDTLKCIVDYGKNTTFLNCQSCNAWYEVDEKGYYNLTKRRPSGFGRKMVNCPKCGNLIAKSWLNKPYSCTKLGGHVLHFLQSSSGTKFVEITSEIKELILKAKEKAGSWHSLAREVSIHKQNLKRYLSGEITHIAFSTLNRITRYLQGK